MVEVEDDAGFLSLVKAAEAEALGAGKAKHWKVSTDEPSPPLSVKEGSYMAALRGSRSSLWQQQQKELKLQQKKINNVGLRPGGNASAISSSSNGNAYFNCGMVGHWARDCTTGSVREGEGAHTCRVAFIGGEDGQVLEKPCPCGAGSCLVLTSSTVKNPGRKFYRFPTQQEVYKTTLVEKYGSEIESQPSFDATIWVEAIRGVSKNKVYGFRPQHIHPVYS